VNQGFKLLKLILISCFISACANDYKTYAPVTEISVIEPIPRTGSHTVVTGETLYSIAWRYGLDFNNLAKYNKLTPPYSIKPQDIIYLNKQKSEAKKPAAPKKVVKKTKKPTTSKKPITKTKPQKKIIAKPKEKEPTAKVTSWAWPAKGKVIAKYSSQNKGINIAGRNGSSIRATANGKVVYSGNGLKGYGNLLIIKHNKTYLTAYAHNSKILVKNGDFVKQGQTIAHMGNTGTRKTMLHFEIRRNGKPVNPLHHLK